MKLFNYWYLSLVVLLSLGCHSCAQNKVTIDIKEDEQLIEFTTDRFTLPNLHVTPDGESIIFDVLGDIYQAPIEGGKAEVLLQDSNWKRAGKLSPNGKKLAYVSDETGVFQVWTIDLETKKKRSYPIKESVHYPLFAYWDMNEKLLIPSEEGLRSYDVLTGKEKILRKSKEEEKNIMHTTNRKMTVDKTGANAFYQFDSALWAYDLKESIDKYIGEFKEKRKKTLVNFSPNGQKALYYAPSSEESKNIIALKYWDLETNEIKKIHTTKDLGYSTKLEYSFDFINEKIIILDKEGEIVRMDIETGDYKPIPIKVDVKKIIKKPLQREPQYIKDSIITASVLRNPVTRPGLDTIYFGAFGKLHSYAKMNEDIKEMYPDEDRFEVSPSLSPGGKFLAFTTWSDLEMGHLFVRDLETRKEYQLTKDPGRYINPTWSPDGSEIVFVADETEAKLGIPYQTPGAKIIRYSLDIYRVGLKSFKIQEIEKPMYLKRIYPMTNTPRRFYPVPVYHPNGKSIFISSRNKEKDLPSYLEINLDSKEIINETLIPFHTDEVLISPDAKHIAFIYDEQVWVNSYPYSSKIEFAINSKFIPEKFHYKGGYVNNILLPNAHSIYELAPSYLYWQNEYTLMWGSAEEVYTYDVRTGKTEKIADIKVQKSRAIPKAQYALTNAKIITINKNDDIIEEGTVLVKDNRIESVGEVSDIIIPKGYKIFNLKGKTIIPGLIDVHAHYHLFPYEFNTQQDFQYIGNLAYGVTSVFDPSVNVLDYREQAQMIEAGVLTGPRVFASGDIIMYGKREYNYKNINNINDAIRLLRSLKKLNVYGPIKEYGILDNYKRKLLRESAKQMGLSITTHQDNYTNAISRVINGYTAMEHEIGTFSLNKDITTLIGLSKVNYTPTYIVRPGIANIYDKVSKKEEEKLLLFNGQILYHNFFGYVNTIENKNKMAYEKKWNNTSIRAHSRALKTLKEIVDVGGKVSIGGHGDPLPGIGTHWELWFMTKAMTKYQALQVATINGATKLDLQEELGSIEKGKLADMVVLNSDPLESIFNTTDILFTILNGKIYEAETMKQIDPFEKELQAWGWNSPIILKSMENIYLNQ